MATKSLERLVDSFYRLPGIGKKSATRLAFHMIDMDEIEIEKFIASIKEAKATIKKCSVCGNFSDEKTCYICGDITRDHKTICVVEDSKDITSFEKSGAYEGVYHVLEGKIAPLNGVTPDKLNIKSLLTRVATDEIKEVILALNPDLEGETTAMYLTKLLKPFEVEVTRIASGIPIGGNIEFADIATIAKAMNTRRAM